MSILRPQPIGGDADTERGSSPWARLLIALGAIACLWLGGFLYFISSLPAQVDDPDGATDAIIVLTGGADRLAAGARLLAEGKAKALLISGVDRGTGKAELQRLSGLDAATFDCCVKLGREASDTEGNAIEAELWMRRAGYTSLRLVTASYHMPRSVLAFEHTIAGVRLVAHPVFPEAVKIDEWWRYPGTARLLTAEFAKYLVTLITVRLAGPKDAPAANGS